MRILVTRPGEDGIFLAKLLNDVGVDSIVDPLMSIQQIYGPQLKLEGVQALLLTSANGVRALVNRSQRRDIPIYAVGEATATTAKELGFAQVHSADGNVDLLVDLVEKILKPEDGSLLHIAGSSIAGDLIKVLSNRGFQCSREVLYKTNNSRRLLDSTIVDIKQNKIDAVLLYSPRSAEIFVDLIRKARLVRSCQNIILICLSDAVYKKTLKIQWKEVKTSSEPNQGAIIKLVSILAGNSEPMHKNNKLGNPLDEARSIGQTKEESDKVFTKTPLLKKITVTAIIVFLFLTVIFMTKEYLPNLNLINHVFTDLRNDKSGSEDIEGRLKILEKKYQVPNFKSLEDERRRLKSNLNKTLDKVNSLEKSISSLRNMIDAINIEINTNNGKDLSEFLKRLQVLENDKLKRERLSNSDGNVDIIKLAENVEKIKKIIPTIKNSGSSNFERALIISVAQLREAIFSSKSFNNEVETLILLCGKDKKICENLNDQIMVLSKYSKIGIPNLEQLKANFAEKAGRAVTLGLKVTDASWIQEIFLKVREKIVWRKTDDFYGDGVEAIIARAERDLSTGNLRKAVIQLSALKEKPRSLMAKWLIGAQSHIEVQNALAQLQTKTIANVFIGQ
tara:strand:+ start:2615 stop:4474 length:1860 start_codon:yes stop_codon:yes gene_type:complete